LPDGPIDFTELFPHSDECELEIGFGKGASLLERARQCPKTCLIGIEVKPKLAFQVAERCRKEGLGNAHVYADDVGHVIKRSGPSQVLNRVFIHFPDPWWKKKHTKRRVITLSLLDELARLLKEKGELFIQTDVKDRALDYHSLLMKHPEFELQGAEGWVSVNPFGAPSNREIRAVRDGLPMWRILAHRKPLSPPANSAKISAFVLP
jgi:tRNA (guanine-N7-)-methyltransferase